jgi:hypothetical protein
MAVDYQNMRLRREMRAQSGVSPASRRAFLAGTGAAAGAAAVAGLVGGPLAGAARAADPGTPMRLWSSAMTTPFSYS